MMMNEAAGAWEDRVFNAQTSKLGRGLFAYLKGAWLKNRT